MYNTFEEIIFDVKQVAKFCWDKGWAEKNSGNLSINISDLECIPCLNLKKVPIKLPKCKYPLLFKKWLLVSNANSKFRDIAISPEKFISILKICSNGSIDLFSIDDNSSEIRPTSELESHLSIQNAQIEITNGFTSILHTHPTALIALSHLVETKNSNYITDLLNNYYPETSIYLPEGIGFIPYHKAGSSDLAVKTAQSSKKFRLNIWERHGCISVEKKLTDAFDLIDIAEKTAMIFLLAFRKIKR